MFQGFGGGSNPKKDEPTLPPASNTSNSNKNVQSLHGFDPQAFERAAKAAKEASKTAIHATTDDSNVKGEPPLDQLRTMLQPTWDKVYKAMGSPKAIPSDPLFLVVPAFAIIGLILGATTSGGGKSSTKASKTSATKNTTKEKDNDTKTSKSSSTRSKRSSTPSARGKSKRN